VKRTRGETRLYGMLDVALIRLALRLQVQGASNTVWMWRKVSVHAVPRASA
jgi:hypothetical protein